MKDQDWIFIILSCILISCFRLPQKVFVGEFSETSLGQKMPPIYIKSAALSKSEHFMVVFEWRATTSMLSTCNVQPRTVLAHLSTLDVNAPSKVFFYLIAYVDQAESITYFQYQRTWKVQRGRESTVFAEIINL